MAHSVAQDCRLYVGPTDFSGDSNSIDPRAGTTVVEDGPTFGQTVITNLAGLTNWSIGAAGLLTIANDGSDEMLHTDWDRGTDVFTASPTGTDGDRCWFGQVTQSEFRRQSRMNDVLKWTWGGASRSVLVPGFIIHTKASRSTTGNGTAFQLGAVAAGKSLYAALHVFTATGTTLDVKVQSDDNSGMSSATDRITFTQVATTPTSLFSSVAGSITDDYWRIVYTISGTGPYVLAVAAGIL